MQQPADAVVRPAIKHLRRSVVRDAHELGNMDHERQTQPRVRFTTEANILRAEVGRLRQERTMEAGALTRLGQHDCTSAGGSLDHLRAVAQPADQFQSHQERSGRCGRDVFASALR